jgi:hypothetical protein
MPWTVGNGSELGSTSSMMLVCLLRVGPRSMGGLRVDSGLGPRYAYDAIGCRPVAGPKISGRCRERAVPSTGAKPMSLLWVHGPPDHQRARLAGLAPQLPAHVHRLGHSERWSSAGGRQSWRQPFLTATVRVFCEGCNSGWMSEVEGAAGPIVGPMVTGQAAELDADDQLIVANWVALKGLVAVQTSQVEQPVPEYHYGRVHHYRGAVPDTIRVWIGWRANLAAPNRTDRMQLFDAHFMPVRDALPQDPLPPHLESYRGESGVFNATIFQVGHFFALALQHDWPGLPARVNPGTQAADALLPIWPTGPTVHWPPPRPVDVLGDPHKVTRFLQIGVPLAPVPGP